MADQPKKVKARGRARQTRSEEARRPGAEPQRGGEGATPAAVHPQQPNGGRRNHRGVPRVGPLPSEGGQPSTTSRQVEGVTQQLAAASLAGQAPGRGAVARRPQRQQEPQQQERPPQQQQERPQRLPAADDNTRPPHVEDKRGKAGTPVIVLANYFQLLSKPQWAIYQYHCDFSPVVESSGMRRAFMREHKDKLGNCFLFDGMSDLKTVDRLGESLELFSKRMTDGETIRITLKRVADLAPSHPELQRLFNTQMRRNLQHLQFQLVGRHYFDPSAISEVQQYNLQIWQGCITSIRQHESSVLMCVDTVHKVVRKETALQVIQSLYDSRDKVGTTNREKTVKELAGQIVMTRYNNKTYRVEDVDYSLNPTKTFESRNGPIQYLQYYKQQYDINIQDHKQPLLLCTSKEKEIRRGASVSKKIFLIPELCFLTGLTDAMRNNFNIMKELGNYTRVNPAKRVDNLNRFIQRVTSNVNIQKEMREWGLEFSTKLVEIQARVLPSENIYLKGNIMKQVPQDKDFTVQIRADPMRGAVDLNNWVIIFTARDKDKALEMLGTLTSVARKLGMRIGKPRLCEIRDDRINSYMSAATNEADQTDPQLIMFLLTNNRKERYDALKKFACVDYAIPSQCVITKTISKPKSLMTVATKLAIQMNCKLGGEPWALAIPLKSNVMICGYDTYHDSSRRGRSAGAFVSSMNGTFTRWYSQVNFHRAGGWEELSNHMGTYFTMAIKKYQEVNKTLPDLIIVYRDGVGDGQIRYVKEWEIDQFTQVLNSHMKNKGVNWAYIVVNKRINTRFFNSHNKNISNPVHGTIVDDVVTRYDRYDFFLVSQLATQGTVSPTQYNVIEDHSRLKPDHIQRLTYKLTHLYFNCSATISVPAPCQYAHKLAFLAGQSLHQPPHPHLRDRLFYL